MRFDKFTTQLQIAASAGACGFMAGRAIWGDAVGRYDAERRAAGARAAVERLEVLHGVLRSSGRGWRRPVTVDEAEGGKWLPLNRGPERGALVVTQGTILLAGEK